MKKFNLNEFLWFLCLIFIELYLVYLLQSKNLYNYIHPKMKYYTLSGALIIGIVLLFQIRRIFTIPSRQGVKKGYIIFLFAFTFMVYGMGITGHMATEYKGVTLILDNHQEHGEDQDHGEINETGVIEFSKEHYYCYFEELQKNPEKFKGRDVLISGVVFKTDESKGIFYLGRSVLNCCVADSENLAFIFKTPEEEMPNKAQWLEVKGILDVNKVEYKGQQVTIPTIKVLSFNVVPSDENKFLYKEV